MQAKRMLLATLLLAVAGGVAAQKIYRSVGPDGKVVFSDSPPADRDAVMLQSGRMPGAPAAAAPAAAAPASASAPTATPRDGHGAKQAKKALPASEKAPAATGPSQAAIDAGARSLAVLTNMELLVKNFEGTCLSTLPTSMKKYSGAADTWRGRHAQLLAKRDAALAHLTAAQRRTVMDESSAFVQKMMQPVQKAQPAQRIQWCDHSAQEIMAGKLDRHQDPAVTEPLNAIVVR